MRLAGVSLAVALVATPSAHADTRVVEPLLGHHNRQAFFLEKSAIEVHGGVAVGESDEDDELRFGLRTGGFLYQGGRSLGEVVLVQLRVSGGIPITDGQGRDLRTGVVDLRIVEYRLAGTLRVALLPAHASHEHRFGRELSGRVDLVSIGGRIPLLGDIGTQRWLLLVHGDLALAGYRREDYVAADTFDGFDLGSFDAALTLSYGESFWGSQRFASVALSLGGTAGTAVGDSTPMSGPDWVLDAGAFAELRVDATSFFTAFARGDVHAFGDGGNDNIDGSYEASAGVRLRL